MAEHSTEREPDDPLVMWTMYCRPVDYPEHIVARKWLIRGDDEPLATAQVIVADDLATLRRKLSDMGLYCVARHASDEPQIVETWF